MTTEQERRPVETVLADRLQVEIHESRVNLGVAAARAMAQQMKTLLAEKDRVRIVFASAPSQNEFLAELRSIAGLDWRRVTAFHMDEYVGLSPDAPQSFSRFLVESLFDGVKPGAFYPLNGLAADPEAECRRYAALLEEAPIDIVCAGIGENGHLAFNDPPVADFEDPRTVKVVDLTLRSREQQVHDGCFAGLDVVPRQALTLTVSALMKGRAIYCMVPGPTKAEAVRDTLLGPVATTCPATVMRRHTAAHLYVDRESAALYLGARG